MYSTQIMAIAITARVIGEVSSLFLSRFPEHDFPPHRRIVFEEGNAR